MHIALGTTVLSRGIGGGGVDGIGRYTLELMRHLQAREDVVLTQFAFESGKAASASHINIGPFTPQALASLAAGVPFPYASRRIPKQCELVHATDHLIPKLRSVPVVATLMDAVPIAHPEWVTPRLRSAKNFLWRRSAQWADRIITISEHSKRQIVEWFSIAQERIDVVPLGVAKEWFSAPSDVALKRVAELYGLPDNFFLFVGTIQPRKNLARLLAAHRQLPATYRREFPLIVAGRPGWDCESEVYALGNADPKELRWLRYVKDEDLIPLVSSANALVFPSLHEGFGLPVLEAFAAGTPVITSSSTSLPEVAGDAALLVNPLDEQDISAALTQIIEDPTLCHRLMAAGVRRAELFSWQRTTNATREVYSKALTERAA